MRLALGVMLKEIRALRDPRRRQRVLGLARRAAQAVRTAMAAPAWPGGQAGQAPSLAGSLLFGRAMLAAKAYDRQRALPLFERYFRRFQDQAPLPAYVQFVVAIEQVNPPRAAERIAALLAAGLERWPAAAMRAEGADDRTASLREDAARFHLWLGERHLKEGRVDSARQVLAAIPDGTACGPTARDLEQVARSVAMLDLYRDLAASDPDFAASNTILPWRTPGGADQVILAFSGGDGALWLSRAALHRMLRGLGCHVVYLADVAEGFYLRGPDWRDPDELLARLRAVIADLGATRIYCLGQCSGAYGALRYGLDLGAEAILAFSPMTTPTTTAAPGTRARLRQLAAELPGLEPDLDRHYARATAIPRVTITCGAAHKRDLEQARRLQHLPGVRLIELPAAEHNSIRWLIAKGRLLPLLHELLGRPA